MKKTLFSVLALAPAMALAQPSVGPVGSIDVSAVGPTPTDSVVYNGTLIFGEFTNARVGQITNPTAPGSAVVSTLFGVESGDSNLAGFTPVTFDTAGTGDGAGISSLDLTTTDTLLVSGSLEDNPGSTAADGLLMTVDLTGPTLITQNGTGLNGGNPVQTSAGFFYGPSFDVWTSFNNGTHFWGFDPITLTSDAGFLGDGGIGAFGRFQTDAETYETGSGQEVYIAGNSRFFDVDVDLSEPAGTEGIINIRRYNPGSDIDDFTTATPVPNVGGATMGNGGNAAWFTFPSTTAIAANGYQGVGIYDDGTNVWIMLANTVEDQIIFVNRATGVADGTLTVAGGPTDATMYDDGTDRWLFVSTEGGTIEVFQEGASTSVQGWELFQ